MGTANVIEITVYPKVNVHVNHVVRTRESVAYKDAKCATKQFGGSYTALMAIYFCLTAIAAISTRASLTRAAA